LIRRAAIALLLGLLAAPAFAAPIPIFNDPKALLEAVYAQIKASENGETYDQDAAFDTLEAFSSDLYAAFLEADADVRAAGNDLGALDFSPFLDGPDSEGRYFAVGDPTIEGGRATLTVVVTGNDPEEIGFELVEEGARGWKVDDVILPGYPGDPSLRLTQYFIDRAEAF
jgi:hypothetical protein